MENEDRFRIEREEMVRNQLERRGVRDARVLDAMRKIPRHLFVPPELRSRAYEDGPLPIGISQTISQPYIVGAMSELLELRGTENVLEIGTGSGYQAAVLTELARSVHSVERHAALAEQAAKTLAMLGYQDVFVHIGDGSLGWVDGAPYQAVLVTAAAPDIPKPLVDQLGEGGRLVVPVGNRSGQMLERWRKVGGVLRREKLFPVAFVPLRGTHGWQDEEWE